MKCKLWTETLEFSRLKVPTSRFSPSLIHGLCAFFASNSRFFHLFQAPLDTPLDSPFSATLSVHGLHFTVCALSTYLVGPKKCRKIPAKFPARSPSPPEKITDELLHWIDLQERRENPFCFQSGGNKRDKLKGTNARDSQFFADFCRFSLFLGITAFRGRRFSQKTTGIRRFSQKTAGNRRFLQKPLCPI